jgi:predicted DNA-binding transcriptional regulator YafY
MRAARVLDMLLLLQRRGRLTAQDLAETLEVSERTILRDVEARRRDRRSDIHRPRCGRRDRTDGGLRNSSDRTEHR